MTELEDKIPNKSKIQGSLNGVRSITYTPDVGGLLMSISYQNYINIWSPDSSLSKSFVGRLEGHSGIITACRVIKNSPNCISVDDKHNIRVWDLRSMMTIQMIRNEGVAEKCVTNYMDIISKEDKFILSGKRIQVYNNDTMRKNIKDFNDELMPLACEFNLYYKTFVVMTKIDFRVYDALTGRLVKVITSLNDEKTSSDLKDFTIGSRERKAIVADNMGLLRVYNINSGELIEKVVKQKNLKERIERAIKNRKDYKKRSFEIVKVIFLNLE